MTIVSARAGTHIITMTRVWCVHREKYVLQTMARPSTTERKKRKQFSRRSNILLLLLLLRTRRRTYTSHADRGLVFDSVVREKTRSRIIHVTRAVFVVRYRIRLQITKKENETRFEFRASVFVELTDF